MKVFIIGLDFFDYTHSLENAFKKLGHDADSYNFSFKWGFFGKIHQFFFSFLNKNVFRKNHLYCAPSFILLKQQRKLLLKIDSFKPDLIVAFPGYGISCRLLKKLSHYKKMLWVYDVIERLPFVQKTLKYYSEIFTFEKTDIPKYEKIGFYARFLPLCADESNNYPLKSVKDIDVLFIGNLSAERIILISHIVEVFPNINIVVYGKYSPSLRRKKETKLLLNRYESVFANKVINQQEANNLYSRSKICINMHHNQTKNGANMRFFELLASNAFQLVDSNPFIEENFSDSVSIYHSQEELIEKIKYYLEHDEDRLTIAQTGYQKALRNELFKTRAETILIFAGGKVL